MATIELSDFDIKPASSTFGVELLMNDKSKSNMNSSKNDANIMSDIQFDDLNMLEKELNDLSFADTSESNTGEINMQTFFEGDIKNTVSFDNLEAMDDGPTLGKMASMNTHATTSTWDGYQKFDDIPLHNLDKVFQGKPSMTTEELQKEKFSYLRKLESLEKKGVELSKKYNMESSLNEMMGEYETIVEEKNKQNSIKFQGNMLMAVINGLEFLNNKLDPFDIKLDGWGDQINDNMSDYDDIFGELYEKYKTKASMAPELKLLFQLAGSGIMIHMSNTLFRSSMPSMDDIMRQNPDLMRHFQSAAVNSMAPKNPGFSGFVNGLMSDNSKSSGPPPPTPIKTQTMDNTLYQSRGGNNTSGNVNKIFTEQQQQQQYNPSPQTPSYTKTPRPEMKGPSDISSILSNLKTKTIQVSRTDSKPLTPNNRNNISQEYSPTNTNDNSVISISDLKDLQNGGVIPSKRGRRKNSNKALNSVNINL